MKILGYDVFFHSFKRYRTFLCFAGAVIFFLDSYSTTSGFSNETSFPSPDELLETGPYRMEKGYKREHGVVLAKCDNSEKIFLSNTAFPGGETADIVQKYSGKCITRAWIDPTNSLIRVWRLTAGDEEIITYRKSLHYYNVKINVGWGNLKFAALLFFLGLATLVGFKKTNTAVRLNEGLNR